MVQHYQEPSEKDLQNTCLHNLFEAQAERTPEAIAVVAHDQHLTYRELNARANQLAHFLHRLHVGPDVMVSLCLERSLDMLVGILGVFKAGGACVPLDPAYPKSRLTFVIQDAQASVLLTQTSIAAGLPEHVGTTICLDMDWPSISEHSPESPQPTAQAHHLSCVMYTSGSTGRPKGVMLTHAGVCRSVEATRNAMQVTAQDRYLHTASLAFSVAIRQMMVPLSVGATVVLASSNQINNPLLLLEVIKRHKVTVMDIVPTYWRTLIRLLETLEPGERQELLANMLRLVSAFGEPLPFDIPQRWTHELNHGARLMNLYAQTETGVVATYPITVEERHRGNIVPLGRPVGNIELSLLDEHLHPVADGEPGELYIGSDSLARGYLNQPELTAEKFITPSSQFTVHSSQSVADNSQFSILNSQFRLYRTGDLGRRRPDGSIEFLGRADHLLKVRGFRIEPGEIETVLAEHPAVQVAAIASHEDPKGEQRLVAYLVPSLLKSEVRSQKLEIQNSKLKTQNSSDDGQRTAGVVRTLRNFLRQKLPDYMLPSAFVFCDALPLNQNGKLDRRALPPPDWSRLGLQKDYVASRTPQEEALARIWSEILGVQPIGMDDNFFDLGGHSLLATQVISRVNRVFHLELSVPGLFAAPTPAQLAAVVTAAGKPQETQDSGSPVPLFGTVPRQEPHRLSFAQQRLWFLSQLYPNSVAYNLPIFLRFTGKLVPAVLEHSLNEILRRHEALRTTFTQIEGQPIQVVSPQVNLPLPVTDIRNFPEAEKDAEVRRLATAAARQPFHLETGPLVRATLVQVRDDECVLLIVKHHIVSDGWSVGIFIQELTDLYEAFSLGRPSPLKDFRVQYLDFANWQREWLQSGVMETQLAYWKRQLGGSLPVLDLPTDHPRPPVQTANGAERSLVLSHHLAEALDELSRQEGVTVFMTLLAAFNVLLHRYTGQTDIIIGTPIANRNHVEIEQLIGFFVNTLALRTDLSGDPGFRDVLQRVRQVALGAYAHQDVPFEKLVDELRVERDLSRTPFFQVMLVLQNAPVERRRLPDVTMNRLWVDSRTAKFDLTLTMRNCQEGLTCVLEYNTDLFDAATAERMLGHLNTLLEGIVAHPEQRIATLPLLTEAERRQLLVEWNSTRAIYPKSVCLHHLFEAQAAKTPGTAAVVYEDQKLTYAELNARSNQLAHHLRRLGVGPEVLVGLCVERSLEMVVGLVGILKAGGAYVPLDPGYPSERLAFMVEDTRMPVLVTHSHLGAGLPRQHGARVVALDADRETISQESTENPESAAGPDHPAYVIYTSGSTGRPKGVLVTHYNVVRLFEATQDWFHFDQRDVWTLFHSYAFDFSVWELWGALLYGGRLVVVPYLVSRSPETFYDLLHKEQVTVLNQTPSAFRQLIQVDEAQETVTAPALRLVIFGGEALELQSLKPWTDRHGDTQPQLVNMYGITETTVHVTYRPLTAAEIASASGSVIGCAIPDLQVYILDQELQPVPVGVPGEMHVGGAGLARGYLNRPELTAQRFIEWSSKFNVQSSKPEAENSQLRLYRTGDLARYLPNGDIEYLGRIDLQVKVRGFRIELGEIESSLVEHPSVREAVVLMREDVPGDKRLVAYIVGSRQYAVGGETQESEQRPTAYGLPPTELRRFLKEKLPDFMIPSVFVTLEALPLTSNGKVDRRALPVPDQARPELAGSYMAPRTPTEETLAKIWADLLRLERVGIHDNFFTLGGHSLLATQVISRVQRANIGGLSLRDLFESPTVAGLSRLATSRHGAPIVNPISKIEKIPGTVDGLLEKIGQLSDAEVELLLGDMLAEEGLT